jgi:hypothetical protein
MEIETDYETVVSNGEVTRKESHHIEQSRCDCSSSAPLSSYRDVHVLFEDKTFIFYHSTAIVVQLDENTYRLSSGGWDTKSTKQRINTHLPYGYSLVQRSHDWYIEHDGELQEFEDEMVIEV